VAEDFTDAGALGEDLGGGSVEGVLRVECALPPGRVVLVVLVDEQLAPFLAGIGDRGGDSCSGPGVVVENRPGDVGAAGDGGD